jgi:hypothetical protein
MLGCHVKDSRGGVIGWCHTCRGVTWWSYMWCSVVESSDGVKWWSHKKESLGGVTHVGVSCEGFTWWSQVVESHEGVTWQS